MADKLRAFIAKFFDRTFWKFIIVGVVNTLFGSAVMFGFYNLLHLSYWVSSAANYFFGSILSYFLNKHFTFKNREKGAGTVVRFVINIALCYLIAYGAAKPLARLILSGASETVRDNVAMLVGMGLFVMLNYVGQRFFAFADTKKEQTGRETRGMEKLRGLNSSNYTLMASLGLIWAFMLLLNLLTPYCADDYGYMISFKTQGWIKSVWDIFPSMAAHAKTMNGRLISHGLGQLFMLWPKAVFDIFNAGVFTALVWLIYSTAAGGRGDNALLLGGIFLAIWYFLPVFGQVALWQLGSVNYLWGLAAGMLFLRPYIRDYLEGRRSGSVWRRVLFCLLALPFGMYTEVTSFVGIFLAAVLLLLGWAVKKRRLGTWLWLPVVIAAAGYLLMMNMPAEMKAKSGDVDLAAFLSNVNTATEMLRQHGLTLLCVWAAAMALGMAMKLDPDRLTVSAVLALGAVTGNYMLSVASYYPERCFCTTAALLIAATSMLVPEFIRRGRAGVCAGAGAVLAVAAVFSLVAGTYDIWTTHTAFAMRRQRIDAAIEQGLEEVSLERIRPTTKYSACWGLIDLSDDPDTWPNNYIHAYYGIRVRGK